MITNCEKSTTKYGKKVWNVLNIKFDCEPIYGDNDKYIKTKIKKYDSSVNTNFQVKKVPRERHQISAYHS